MKVMSSWIFVIDWVLSHWFPTRKSSYVGAGRQEDRATKEAYEGRDLAEWRCGLARGRGYNLTLIRLHISCWTNFLVLIYPHTNDYDARNITSFRPELSYNRGTLNMIFNVTMFTLRMTIVMNELKIIVMDDDESIQWPKLYLLLSTTCDGILSWIIVILMKTT